MSPYRRRSSSSRGRRQTRKLVWCTKNLALTQTAAGHVSNVDLLTDLKVAGASLLGCTVIRTHLTLSVSSTVAAGNDFFFGLIVGQQEQTGLDFVPATRDLNASNPSELELSWLWWEHPVAAPTFDKLGTNIVERDVHSKRKIAQLNQTYLLSLTAGLAAGNVSTQLVARTLLALP